jgi:hypothetical protein
MPRHTCDATAAPVAAAADLPLLVALSRDALHFFARLVCCSHADRSHLQGASHARSLQQEQFAESPPEQDVADLAAAAGVRVEDLRFDSTLDDKVGVRSSSSCYCIGAAAIYLQ